MYRFYRFQNSLRNDTILKLYVNRSELDFHTKLKRKNRSNKRKTKYMIMGRFMAREKMRPFTTIILRSSMNLRPVLCKKTHGLIHRALYLFVYGTDSSYIGRSVRVRSVRSPETAKCPYIPQKTCCPYFSS
jgi:hypothetical protein